MKVTICIPVCYEIPSVKGCINQILKYKHPEIEHEILIMDQCSETDSKILREFCYGKEEVSVVKIKRVDAGYPIDIAVRMATGEYFCSLDADAFPISDLWLYLPVKLIEKFGFSFVGKESGLHHSYKNELGKFFHINNYYRVSRTDLARNISENIGFIRPFNKGKVELKYKENVSIWCDNGVLAQWYSDKHNLGPKLSLSMNKIIGATPRMGVYGMVIDDLIFHMVFGQTNEEYGLNSLGEGYAELSREISASGLTDKIIEKIVSMSKTENIIKLYGEDNLRCNGRQYYDNDDWHFLSANDEISKFIEDIKAQK